MCNLQNTHWTPLRVGFILTSAISDIIYFFKYAEYSVK